MKNKLLVSMLFVLSILMLGCTDEKTQIVDIDNNEKHEIVENLENLESSSLEKDDDSYVEIDEKVNTGSLDETSVKASSDELEPITLKDELGRDYDELTKAQIQILSTIYDDIASFEFSDDNEDDYNELWSKFNSQLASMGIDVPFKSYLELADEYENILSIKDYNRIFDIDEKLQLSGQDMVDDEEYEKLNDELIAIFDKYKLPGKEIKTQVDMGNVQIALFDVRDGLISLSEESIKQNIDKHEMDLYNRFWGHIKTIIPSSYIDMLSKFEINTDGMGNVMAHVIEEKTDLSVWRLAVDLKDSADANGNFTSEFDNTVIHEFAHVMTLGKDQMQMEEIVDRDTFEVQEGILKKDSYLNRFYQKFWKDIYKEHQLAVEKDTEQGMPSGGDQVYNFYEKYEDQFVTDYAATNPGEDIAESYRFFVVEKMPTGSSIKDKKILFFYEMDSFVKIRNEIRENLGLE